MLYALLAVGLVGVGVLSLVALRLFRTVQQFGQEVSRVSAEISKATRNLEQAAATAPEQARKQP